MTVREREFFYYEKKRERVGKKARERGWEKRQEGEKKRQKNIHSLSMFDLTG